MRFPSLASLSLCLLSVACGDRDPLGIGGVRVASSTSILLDATTPGGNAHFFFLEPVRKRVTYSGMFDPTLVPDVVVTLDGVDLDKISATVNKKKERYEATWSTKKTALMTERVYKLSVRNNGRELGSINVFLASNKRELPAMSDDFIGLVFGRELSISFRIEQGAVPFYRASNGKTIVCAKAQYGDTGRVGGVLFTKRERAQLDALIASKNYAEASVTCTSGIESMEGVLQQPVSEELACRLAGRKDCISSVQKDLEGKLYAAVSDVNVSTWDVSQVTDMSMMFSGQPDFNQDISGWDVSNVTTMRGMFAYDTLFNQDISGWNVSNVRDMSLMFSFAKSFNQPIGRWNVSNVVHMSNMFGNAESFNQPIGTWNVSNVESMDDMFTWAKAFNQPIGGWNVSRVSAMAQMFAGAVAFNQAIGDWALREEGVLLVSMFQDAWSFNQPIGRWNVRGSDNLSDMFKNAVSFNQDIGDWDVSETTNFERFFEGAAAFNQDISRWNMSKAFATSQMFKDAVSFNQSLSSWDMSNVVLFSAMFAGASSFNGDVSGWNVSSAQLMDSTFFNASAFNKDLSSWCAREIESEPMEFAVGASAWTLPRPNWGGCSSQLIGAGNVVARHTRAAKARLPLHKRPLAAGKGGIND